MTRRERLLEKLKELQTGPKRSLGQNFLIADGVIERILERAGRPGFSELLEIGPGLGALTEGLIEISAKFAGSRLRVIELDRAFADDWRSRGVEVIEGDALQIDWAALALKPGARLVSNLPYQISSSLVIDRSVWPTGVASMVLMFQKEVARRVTAQARSEDYGLLSVIAQIGWTVNVVSEAGPGDFYPPPRVASRVLGFERRADAPDEVEFAAFLKFAKAAYSHRRKLMVKNLEPLVGNRERLESLLVEHGHSIQARVEELSPEKLLAYFRSVRMAGGK
ncbi:MAG: ribosomal RNA small subunit methyltransferase A [Bdellovibrionales bacterium]|nr:ribosomal RNA small subunit methyltransferase A [Bdellovibrionales bacterium]